MTELDTLLPKFKEQLHQTRKSKTIKAMEEADAERDDAFLTLKNLIKSYSRVKTAEMKEAYHNLSELFANYKGLASLTYEKETESINHLLAKLKNSPYQEAAERLHLTYHVTTLSQGQKRFELAYQDRLAEVEGRRLKADKNLREELLDRYDLLVMFTTVYRAAYPELVAYQKLHERLNAIRSRFRPQKANKKGEKATTSSSQEVSDQIDS